MILSKRLMKKLPKFSSNPVVRIAIIGLPNVGKSTLFNRLIGRQQAIVNRIPGTTVDRLEARVTWQGREFVVVDTAGVGARDFSIERQIDQAIAQADLVVLVTTADLPQHEVRRRLKDKPLIVVLNKVDDFAHFQPVKNAIAISALHGKNINALLDEIISNLTGTTPGVAPEILTPKIAIVGRPNVGKSTLLNKLLGFERAIVAPTPGTTRDAVVAAWQSAILVDTAGLRRKSRLKPGVETQAVTRALDSIKNADIVLVVIDSVEGVTQQDVKIIRTAHRQAKDVILVFNKIDLAKPRLDRFPFLAQFPAVAICAQQGTNLTELAGLLQARVQNFLPAK